MLTSPIALRKKNVSTATGTVTAAGTMTEVRLGLVRSAARASAGIRSIARVGESSIASPIGIASEPIAASVAWSNFRLATTRPSGSPTRTLTPIIWLSAAARTLEVRGAARDHDLADTQRVGL